MVVGADADVTEEIPLNPLTQPYYEYFGPEHRLNLHTTREVRCLSCVLCIDELLSHSTSWTHRPGCLHLGRHSS